MLTRRNSAMVRQVRTQGFTLIELLVVIGIIGVLAAIALPSFLNQAEKDSARPAQICTSRIIHAQQVFLLKEWRFAASIAELGSPVQAEMQYYSCSIETHETKSFVFGKSKNSSHVSYVAGIFVKPTEKNTSTKIFCVAQKYGTQLIAPPIDANTCGEGTIKIERR
jgi:type IV pilus assembly protein PilA